MAAFNPSEAPPPYTAGDRGPHVEIPIEDANGVPVAWVTSAISDPRTVANALAAAPDLLAACEAMMAIWPGDKNHAKAVALMKAAIAKARGE